MTPNVEDQRRATRTAPAKARRLVARPLWIELLGVAWLPFTCMKIVKHQVIFRLGRQ